MTQLLKPLTLAALLCIGSGGGVAAQSELGSDAPTSDADALSMGQDADAAGAEPQIGDTYLREVQGDWEIRCVLTEDGNDPCQMYQLLSDQEGNSVAEVLLFPLPEGQRAAAGATIITPLETLLTEQLRLAVDGGQNKIYPYTFCSVAGCFARIGFTAAEVAAFKRGAKATLTIVPAAAPDQKVSLTMSLTGFTAGYDSIEPVAGN